MMKPPLELVSGSVLSSIEKNGFPGRKVALPFQPIFKSCKNKGVKLTDVLKRLEEQGVSSEIQDEKILFYSKKEEPDSNSEPLFSPEFLARAMENLKHVDPKQVQSIQSKVTNMAPEERERLLRRAKDLFAKK